MLECQKKVTISSYLYLESFWRKMGNNKNNVLLLVVAVIALAMGLTFAISCKHRSLTQASPNQWQNWNDHKNEFPINPPYQQPEPRPHPQKPDVVPSNPTSYQEAMDMSRRTGKKVFLFFHADWCSWCKKMERDTFSDSSVKQALNQYIVYHVDTGKEREISRKYSVSGIPAYCITDNSEKPTQSGQGYKTPQEFLNWLSGDRNPNRRR